MLFLNSLCRYLRDICSVPSAALGTGDVAVKKEKDEGEKERGRGRKKGRKKGRKEERKERKKGESEGGEKEREGKTILDLMELTFWNILGLYATYSRRSSLSIQSPLAPLIISLRAHSTICTGN